MVPTQLDINSIVHQQVHDALKEHLAKLDIKNLITKSLTIALEDAVSNLTKNGVERYLKENNLSFEIQNSINNKINEYIDHQAKVQVRAAISDIDIKSIINANLEKSIKFQIETLRFPEASIKHNAINWQGFKLSGSHIDDGIITNFNSTGIQDKASDCKLTILDDMIVIENKLIASDIESKKLSVDSILVNNLEITGRINSSGSLHDLIDNISQNVYNRNTINCDYRLGKNSILDNDKLIINSTTLGPGVLTSNLRKVGLLTDLSVQGNALISETLAVMSKKVGINTEDPEGSLSIWDQDSELSIMKFSKNNMFIGTTRNNDLTIGTRKESQIEISKDQINLNSKINLKGIKINVLDNIPDYIGEPNEIVFVKNAKQGQPFLYMCQGLNVWASMGVLVP